MDPIANLKEQREIARRIQKLWAQGQDPDGDLPFEALREAGEISDRLAELVLALDEWRRKGGFDPYLRP